jgi:hypothetical protein
MAFTAEITRPEDLLHLKIHGHNLIPDNDGERGAALVVEDRAQPAYLVVTFPPQTIAEEAMFESSIVPADVPPGKTDRPSPQPTGTPDPPGTIEARIGRSSRLVFQVPASARIPITVDGLLDWSTFTLRVHPIAGIGPNPTPAEIASAPAIRRPNEDETAIELPYRLVISPGANSRWAHHRHPFTVNGRTELWHTRLLLESAGTASELSLQNPAPLRAIWSDDFGKPVGAPDPLQLSAIAPNDRHQIVVLTSAFHGYEETITLNLGSVFGPTIPISFTRPFVPQPFLADQLMLSTLGGYLRSAGHWNPPKKRPRRGLFEPLRLEEIFRGVQFGARGVQPAEPRPAIGARIAVQRPLSLGLLGLPQDDQEQLDLSEWIHVAAQGRDHYVRIVYEGELLPFRNRAALVKVTERKFRDENGVVVARMFQRMFIVVREPEKRFAATDRGIVFKKVRLTTLVTPDIAQPAYMLADAHSTSMNPTHSRSFWVEVMTSPNPNDRARFKFHAVGTDDLDHDVDFTIPMMFVSISDTKDRRTTAIRSYNLSDTRERLDGRSASVPGQKLLFTKVPAGQATDNARLETRALNFVMADGGEAPRLLKADVNIPQVQELLGTSAATTIRLSQGFVAQGLDGATGVFGEIVRENFANFQLDDPFAGLDGHTLGVTFRSDQAGGFATPNVDISTVTNKLGPLAGKAADALTDTFDPKSFFKKGIAQLFGTFDLFDLMVAGTLGNDAPQLTTSSTPIPNGKRLVAKIHWTPKVHDLGVPDPKPIATFKKDHQGTTTFTIDGAVTTPVKLGPGDLAPTEVPTSDFTGKLTNFRIGLLGAVFLNFSAFGFTSKTGRKTDVTVDLQPTPLEFDGDLKFVEELRKIVPPALFGDGPSLDLSPTGIRAGFSFALPPVAVGVFALKDVSLGAALTLPFLNGKPTFDFNVSERPHPFVLSVGIFGGGGFFRLQLDTAGLRVVEAALEFGATASIDLGVASGGVYIMAGIYFKLERKEPANELAPTLSGYLRMGGHLSVLGLIKVSLEFCLSFTYDGGRDKAYGRATLTVKVEIAFFSTSVELTVEKAFGGSSGDPSFKELFETPAVWSTYATAFA